MKVDLNTFENIHRPMYVLEEKRLRRNLELISDVAERGNVEIILAFKAFALWKTFSVFREYIHATTASSLNEARLGYEEFGARTHTYSPAYMEDEIDELANISSHLTFNSLSQYERFHDRAHEVNDELLLGVRVNPEYSEVGTALYNPCSPGTRFGVTADKLPESLPDDIVGFHCHCHCESGADVFKRTLLHIEEKFAKWFPQLQWINFGGGHLMTRSDYDREMLIDTLNSFHMRYPWLKVILEPGSAFAWQTGPLVSQVVDVVEDHGIKTAILDVSFTCHMPDCLEMPYWPDVRGAKTMPDERGERSLDTGDYDDGAGVSTDRLKEKDGRHEDYTYRLGGNSCLSGDFMGFWQFDHELTIGENVIFEDMIHYTTVKTNMFNGIGHPAIAMAHEDGELEILREFAYADYRARMD